jgi:hypothetical protein
VNIITATTPFFLPFHSEIMMMMIFVFELEFGGYNRPSVHPSVHLSDVSEGGEKPKKSQKEQVGTSSTLSLALSFRLSLTYAYIC